MNALVSIDVATLTPATVFAPGGVEGIISKVEAEVRAIDRDISTPDGREAVKSLAYKVARSKTALDDMGKELVAGIKAQAAAIDADRRTIRDRLDALKEEVRGPLTAWETAEADRIALHESALVFLAEAVRFASPPSVAQIADRIETVQALTSRDWQEFQERGDVGISTARSTLDAMLAVAEQAERDAAELAELRQMKAEREERDRIEAETKAKAERAAQEAAEAAEAERIRAERRAEMDRRNAENAARQAEEAAARAIEQERQRVAAAAAAEKAAQEKREANKKHRAKVHAGIAEALSAIIGEHSDAAGPAAIAAAETIVDAIAAGSIARLSITY